MPFKLKQLSIATTWWRKLFVQYAKSFKWSTRPNEKIWTLRANSTRSTIGGRKKNKRCWRTLGYVMQWSSILESVMLFKRFPFWVYSDYFSRYRYSRKLHDLFFSVVLCIGLLLKWLIAPCKNFVFLPSLFFLSETQAAQAGCIN